MRYELKLHRITFGILTLLLSAFVLCLLGMRESLADERVVAIASLAVVIVAAAAFVTMGAIEGIVAFQFGKKHRQELLSYLLLGIFSLSCGLYLAISETASLQTIALAASPHALLFGLAEIRLAQHLGRHPYLTKRLFLGGLIEIALGIALLTGFRMSNEGAVTLLAYVAIISIMQLLPLLFHSHKALPGDQRSIIS